jgi:predicted GTPase
MATPSWLRKLVTEQLQSVRRKLQPLLPHRTRPQTTPRGGRDGGTANRTVAARLAGLREEFEHAVVRLGIIGESGSGKSSLINAIVGRPVAPVGALVETTQEPQEVPVEGLVLVDLPGCGTPTWPRNSYVQRLHLLEAYDGFVLVTAQRIKECDALLFAELARKANKPFFVVRSHFDLAVAAHGEQEAREVIPPYIRRQLQADPDLPVYLVSSVGREHYDLERLILDIRNALPEWKRVRFTMAAHAYGPETLARKREAAEKVVGIYAGLAAANALNPVPGLDISVDVGILTRMARYVISTYGLRKDQVEALQSHTKLP